MYSLLIVLSLLVTVYNVSCEVNSYDYPDDRPVTFVYAVYPYYTSQALLEVWKTDKAVDISANVVTLAPIDQGRNVLYSSNPAQNNETSTKVAQANTNYLVNEAEPANLDQPPKNRQRLTSYRNRRKLANLDGQQ